MTDDLKENGKQGFSRREFLKIAGVAGAAIGVGAGTWAGFDEEQAARSSSEAGTSPRKAVFMVRLRSWV